MAMRHQSGTAGAVRTAGDRRLEDLTLLLRERSRAALRIILVALGVLWATDAVFNTAVVVPLSAITLLQAGVVSMGFFALARVETRRATAAVPMAVLGALFVSGVLSDVISSNPQGVGLSALIACLVSATLMPWGPWFQLVMVVVGAVSGGLSVWLVTGSLASLGYAAGPGVIVMIASVIVAHALERARQERMRVEDDLRLLQSVGLEVGAAADPDAALAIVLRHFCEASAWVIGQAWTLRADESALECSAWWSADPAAEAFHAASTRFTFAPGVGLPGRVWATKRPTWIGDLGDDRNFPRSAAAAAANLTAAMAIPVLADGEVIAVLEFLVRGNHAADERLIARFAGPALQLGSVIQRKRVERALVISKRKADEEAEIAAALVEVGRTLSTHLGRPDMLERVSGAAALALGCEWSAVFMWEDASGYLRLAAAAGLAPDLRASLAATSFPTDGLFVSGDPRGSLAELPDVSRASASLPPLFRRLGAASVLHADLRLGGTPIGIQLHGYRSRTGAFSAKQRRLAAGIADATAIAVANARLIEDLQASSRIKSEFVATMSHELRTPLNIIVGYSDMLGEGVVGELSPEQRDTVARVQRAGVELLDLVNATLDMGRLEAGRDTVTRDAVEVGAVLRQLDVELAPLVAPEVALRWHDHLGPAPLVTDKTKLKTILKNLVGNALKFTATGAVDVIARWDGPQLRLEVRDTGVGIPAESLPVIFEMFRQGDGSSTRSFGGVGLGLHIVRRLVDLLGGHVSVESSVGHGSTFVATWPAVRADCRQTGS